MLSDRYYEPNDDNETPFGIGNFTSQAELSETTHSTANEQEMNEISENEIPFGAYSIETAEIAVETEKNESPETMTGVHSKNKEVVPGFLVRDSVIIHKSTEIVQDDAPIEVLELSTRSYNALRRAKIRLLSDIINMSMEELQGVKNLGKTSVDEVIERLNVYLFRKKELNDLTKNEKHGVFERIEKESQIIAEKTFMEDDTSIEEMPLSVRAKNCLRKNGIMNFQQLMKVSIAEIGEFRNLGDKTLKEIIRVKENAPVFVQSDIPENMQRQMNIFLDAFRALGLSENDCSAWRYYLFSLTMDSEINDETCYNLWYNEAHVHAFIEKYLINLFKKNAMFGLTLKTVYANLPDFMNENSFSEYMQHFINDRLIQVQDNHYILKSSTFIEVLSEDTDDKNIQIMKKRLGGYTLEDIASDYRLTREWVRQLQNKMLEKVKKICETKRISLHEERFKPLFEMYQMNQEIFTYLTEESEETYRYLKITAKQGNIPVDDITENSDIPSWMRNNWEKYCRCSVNSRYLYLPEAHNRRIPKTRAEIELYVLSTYCRDREVTFDEFICLYQKFLQEHQIDNDEKLVITDAERRTQENQISKSKFVLWKYGRRLRYYNISAQDYTELLHTLRLDQYHNTELSTLKFVNEYPELMQQYGIRDEYELHNLLKKIGFGKNNPEITMNMPHIKFGEFDRYAMIKEVMFELAPISMEDLAEIISLEYGYKKDMLITWFECIKEYFNDGMYSVDYKEMPEAQMQIISENLTESFYCINDIKKIYRNLFPDADVSLISSFNLRRMGFIVNSGYVIQHFDSASKYFEHILTMQDITDISEYSRQFTGIMAFSSTLATLKGDYTIIEFEPYQYIHIRRLEQMGIKKEDLREYCDAVFETVENNTYFTVEQLQKEGFQLPLDMLGFAAWFYSSIIREDERFSYTKLGGTVLFYKSTKAASLQNFIEDLIQRFQSIELDNLLDYVHDNYTIVLDKDRLKYVIQNTGLYFDTVMNTLYVDYDTYFEELKAINDEDDI